MDHSEELSATAKMDAAAPVEDPDPADKEKLLIFKKSSPNGKLTAYTNKRDIIDHVTHVDPIQGVVLVDPEYLGKRRVYGRLRVGFRYGQEDLTAEDPGFSQLYHLDSQLIFPPSKVRRLRPVTRVQKRLLKKLGGNAAPFYFGVPKECPASVTFQPGPGEKGKTCAVVYELKIYVAESFNSAPSLRSSVRLGMRRIRYAPMLWSMPLQVIMEEVVKPPPSVDLYESFLFSRNKLHLEISVDKEIYHHGEAIAVNVHIQNFSNRRVKKVSVSVRQFTEVCICRRAHYKVTLAKRESIDGCPLVPGSAMSKIYFLTPVLTNNKDKRGVALDGELRHRDTNLASSTIIPERRSKWGVANDNLGIIVAYWVKVTLSLGPWGKVAAQLPFKLMHKRQIEKIVIGEGGPVGRGEVGKINHPVKGKEDEKWVKEVGNVELDPSKAISGQVENPDKKMASGSAAAGTGESGDFSDLVKWIAEKKDDDAANDNDMGRVEVKDVDVDHVNETGNERDDFIGDLDDGSIIFEEFSRLRLDGEPWRGRSK